jgi:hypothetical protein
MSHLASFFCMSALAGKCPFSFIFHHPVETPGAHPKRPITKRPKLKMAQAQNDPLKTTHAQNGLSSKWPKAQNGLSSKQPKAQNDPWHKMA